VATAMDRSFDGAGHVGHFQGYAPHVHLTGDPSLSSAPISAHREGWQIDSA
jgi:hypothetical protein